MSWSVSYIGKPRAVAAKAAEDFEKIQTHGFHEPEAEVVEHVAKLIAAALSGYPDDLAVKVASYGSQGDPFHHDPEKRGKFGVNTVSISIEAMYGFVE